MKSKFWLNVKRNKTNEICFSLESIFFTYLTLYNKIHVENKLIGNIFDNTK